MGSEILPVPATLRKRVLKVLFISLLLDLISFTFILPLFPKLIEFYRNHETGDPNTILSKILAGLNAYKNSFAKPINSRYDIVLLGGALGSLFSLCQAVASPFIGTLSDKYGRRTALLWSMVGNIFSVALWVAATDFRTFLASRIVGGLSEGNVQLAMAIATDISDDSQRGSTMALVGVCFSIAFTFGPALGAYLSTLQVMDKNPFAMAAGFSLFLIVSETIYLYASLPETLPSANKNENGTANGKEKDSQAPKPHARTNSHYLLNATHFTFILFFSGMEFSLPFMTYDLFAYQAKDSGRLLGFIGLVASLLQGSVVRRMHPLKVVQMGVVSCTIAFVMLGRVQTQGALYGAAALLAVTSATVVTGLNSLSSFEASADERGNKLGNHRSFGQIGRSLGPLIFCTLYWWAGRETAYATGAAGMVAVCGLVFGGLKVPPGTESVGQVDVTVKKRKEKNEKADKEKMDSTTAAAASLAAISGLAARCGSSVRRRVIINNSVHDRAVQWGHFFLAQGVKPGDMVATYLMNNADFMVIWLGLFCIGCAPAHLNYNLKGEGLVHCLKVAGVKIVLVDEEEGCAERFEGVRSTVEEMGVKAFKVDEHMLASVYQGSTVVPPDEMRENVGGRDAACLLYTSGTTGLPKAGKFLINRCHERGNPDNLNFGQKAGPDGDRWYCCMPLFHGTGGMATMSALTGGMSVAIGRKFSVSTFWDDIHDSQATLFVYVGEAARYLLMAPPHPRERDHKLRAMYGNGMRPDVWNRFKERFNVPKVIEFFNSTEGVLAMVVHSKGPFTATSVAQHGALIRRALHDIYVPVAIDPETGDLLRDPKTGFVKRNSYNEGGEILVAVPGEEAFAGYHNNPKATAKKFERNVFKKGDLYYRSGDALRRDDDGRWFFLDRLGDTFRWKSENVSTAEVSEIFGKFPGVGEAIVYGTLVPRHDGRAGCAALRLADGMSPESFDWKALLEFARSKLPRYAVPVFLRLVNVASNTDNQKQNKAPLRNEGIEIDKFGDKVAGGSNDVVMWLKPGADRYMQFTMGDLEALRSGKFTL
ncbi:acetyl-CoA synthetase-like protein [Stemphylium lycopersici]|uniref:Very long-chain fatty acid transport protein n=1 Tax=Stemphylium lycopersici TaxID=183478 RepID=A0A364NA82_STELY|nr:acetyl-CoA synthetase-like protein [Stemphylium lycopersici]RAR14176.1 acetyl-CoA synthetase-like protein [Stemphylium lycopersici]